MREPVTTRPAAQPLPAREARRWARVGALAAFALVLSYAETFVPIPIPGVKLGLANIVVLVALARFDARSAFAIAVIKVLAAGLLFGSPIMMAYSALGTLFAFVGMALLVKIPTMHVVMTSIVGAILHNVGQLIVAQVLLGTPLVWYSAPLLFVAAIVTGALSGVLAASALQALPESLDAADDDDALASNTPSTGECANTDDGAMSAAAPKEHAASRMAVGSTAFGTDALSAGYGSWATTAEPLVKPNPRLALVALIVYMVVVLRSSGLIALGICSTIALLLLVLSRVPARSAAKALRPFFFILLITFVMQVLYQQQGAILAQLGPIAITEGALEASAEMMVRLACLMVASVAFMGFVDARGLIDALKWLATPLQRLGMRVEGPILALDVALGFLPALVEDFRELKTSWEDARPADVPSGLRPRLQMLRDIMPPLLARSFERADALCA